MLLTGGQCDRRCCSGQAGGRLAPCRLVDVKQRPSRLAVRSSSWNKCCVWRTSEQPAARCCSSTAATPAAATTGVVWSDTPAAAATNLLTGAVSTPVCLQACGVALEQHPLLYSSCTPDGSGVTYNERINIAMAVSWAGVGRRGLQICHACAAPHLPAWAATPAWRTVARLVPSSPIRGHPTPLLQPALNPPGCCLLPRHRWPCPTAA